MKHLLLAALCSISAYTAGAKLEYTVTRYSSEDGLSQNTVSYIMQDHKGLLWFATWDGINKFDGYNFRSYKGRPGDVDGLTNNRIDYIGEDKYGFIWVLSYDNKASRFDPRTEKFQSINFQDDNLYQITSIHIMKSGTVWLLTNNEGAIRIKTNEIDFSIATEVYSLKNGMLSGSKVYMVHEDSLGNEWLLTNNGLLMINEEEDKPLSYFVETKSGNKQTSQSFYTLLEMENEIFFGSDRGRVWRYQKKDNHSELLELPTTSRLMSVNTISPDKLIFSTASDGFFTYDLQSEELKHYTTNTCKGLVNNNIREVYVDRHNEVWLRLKSWGVTHFDPLTGICRELSIKDEAGNPLVSQENFEIREDCKGNVWVHPYGGGFSYYDRETKELIPFSTSGEPIKWKSSNRRYTSFFDNQGNLWLSTFFNGLEKITFRKNDFHLLTPNPKDSELPENDIRALFIDRDSNLWVGTKNMEIGIYDKDLNYRGKLGESGKIIKNGNTQLARAYCFTQGGDGVMWIATKGEGIIKAEKINNSEYRLTKYKHDPRDIYSLSNDNVYCIFEDSSGRVWVGTYGGGLNYLTVDDNNQVRFINHRNNLKGYPIDECYRIRFITEDKNNQVWIGTTAGILMCKTGLDIPEELTFNHYFRIPEKINSLSNNDVHSIFFSRTGDMYVATFGGGLNKLISMDADGVVFKSYMTGEGISSDILLSLEEDIDGNIWIVTENGITKFIPSTETFENYARKSFSFDIQFNEGNPVRTFNNEIIVSTTKGLLRFHPELLSKNEDIPHIVFSQLFIANKEIKPGSEDSALKVALDDTDKLVLSHKENVFSVQYAALDMRGSDEIQYACILEGFEKEWKSVGKQRISTYTNLPKGNYVFKVKSTNSDGIWTDNTRTLNIIILPSFWETPWAYLIYVVMLIAVVMIAVYFLSTIYRLKDRVSLEQQIADIKLRFFTDVSHELRTPLTLITGPVEHILSKGDLSKESHEQLQLVKKNTDRMLRLVNQILDFRKIQNRMMKMRVHEVDIIPFIHQIMDSFDSLAKEHQIEFQFVSESASLKVWIDSDKVEKIIFNLISNAFKFTPPGKAIQVSVKEEKETINIEVKDQGIGIAESKQKTIFMRFENLMEKNLFNQPNSGIGLSLVKELVDLHKGNICVTSKENEGSCFSVRLLKGRGHYGEDVEFILADYENVPEERNTYQIKTTQIAEGEKEITDLEDKPTVLLVEDNTELRFFLKSIFLETFNVIEAGDGQEGIEKALQYVPDMIISDLMMPVKDGNELIKELRADISTSHIPIVLLTAKSNIESKLEGLELGADDYITKPFSAAYLKARIDNLLAQRSKLHDYYGAGKNIIREEIEKPKLSANDQKFMDTLLHAMEVNMDNGSLLVDDLVREFGMSRSVFFKKLKSLTGLSPVEFIREIRIKRAAELIETNEYTMAQIAYMVGINDPHYFSKCFKQVFTMTPTEYKEGLLAKREYSREFI